MNQAAPNSDDAQPLVDPSRSEGHVAGWLTVLQNARLGPLIGLAFVLLLFAILQPKRFLTTGNFETMLLQTSVVAIAALGMTLIIISGGIDLSIGSNVALCGVVVARLLDAGASPIEAIVGSVVVGSSCGLVIGLLVTRLGLTPFIVTLGMWGALRGAAKGLAHESTVRAPET
jgi:ribose transport system permease protein